MTLSTKKMTKKTALITGATDGIGKATAQKFLQEGWKVVIIGRNPSRCESTVSELKTLTKNNDISAITVDLSILDDVKIAMEKFLSQNERLDFLLLNANAIANNRIVTKEGFEQNFALGYLSRVLIIKLLESILKNTPNSQILSVIGMDTIRLDFDDLTIEKDFTGRKGLGRWQWSMNVFTQEYNVSGAVPLNLYMPGLVKTKILANEPQPMRSFVKLMNMIVGISVEKSAENIYSVYHEIAENQKKCSCYSWRKERSFPKVEMQSDDLEILKKTTNTLLNKYLK